MSSLAPQVYPADAGPLVGAPLDCVDALSLFPNDLKRGAGQNYFGVALDLGAPEFAAAANTGKYQLIGTSATLVAQAAAAGVFRIASQNVDEAVGVLKLNGGAFLYSATKPLWFVARVALGAALATGEMLAGLALSTYAATDLATLPTDGLFFHKAEAATDLTFHARNGGTSTSIANVLALAGVTLTIDVMVELAFRVTEGSVYVFVNGIFVGSVARGNANLPVTVTDLLTLYIGRQAEGAAIHYIDVDYFLAAAAR